MEEKKVMLADGTEVLRCGAGLTDGNLWLWPELTMKQAAALFLDEEKTARMTYIRDGESIVFEGYTVCSLLNATPEGVRIMMMQGGNQNE